MSSYTQDLEKNYVIAGIIAATGPFWASGTPMMMGAMTGGVAMAIGRLAAVQMSGRQLSTQIPQTAMAAATGAVTGAATMMLLSAAPSISNLLGDYTSNVALAGTVATANYYFDRSTFKNALSGM